MSHSLKEEFGTVRSFFWPIHRQERSKVIPMLLMLFLISLNYSILRCMKDSVVVTASVARAGLIPFIKVWVLLPTALLLILVLSKLSNRYSQERVFYIMISFFLAFYALFAFVLYPLRDFIHPHLLAERLEGATPSVFYAFIEMCRYWTFTGFYVLAELWGSIIMTVLFWGFANEITKVTEARRLYSVFTIAANMAAMAAGFIQLHFAGTGLFDTKGLAVSVPWEDTMRWLILVVLLSGVCIMAIFRWMNKQVLNAPCFDALHQDRWKARQKKRMSIRESLSYLSNSKYLLCIAIMVLGYNLAVNLVELIWKDQLGRLYPQPSDYNIYMSWQVVAIGLFSMLAAFFLPRIIEWIGWTKMALITPILILITSSAFFLFMFFQDSLSGVVYALFGTTPIFVAVVLGWLQNTSSKVAKFSVFDTTKEMSFIPLDHDVKLKGKAAIDGFGSRLGKSGGSVIHQGFYAIFGGLVFSAPYVAGIVVAVISIWVVAVRSLGKQFEVLIEKKSVDVPPSEDKEGSEADLAVEGQSAPANA